MVEKNDKTYNATLRLLARSQNNEQEIERFLSRRKSATSREIANKLGWTLNKTNSTIYRLVDKKIVNFEYIQENGKLIKEITIVSNQDYFK